MQRGDMHLGDILLRSGDLPLAPAGGTHFGINSVDGALFYFHGTFDPQSFAASGEQSWRARCP